MHMHREVSVRDLRNDTAAVVSAVQAGEEVTLTVNRKPVADIVAHRPQRSPWVASHELTRILGVAPADPGLLKDLADVRDDLLDAS